MTYLPITIVVVGVVFVLTFCEGCRGGHASQSIWDYDEEGATAVANGRFKGEINELRVFVSKMKQENDFDHVDNPDVLMSKTPEYITSDKDAIAETLSNFRNDTTYETASIDPPRKIGDRFCMVLFVESKKKQVIYFRTGMPKDRIGSPVTIFPLYETNSLYSSIKVSHWLAKLFKSSGAIPQS